MKSKIQYLIFLQLFLLLSIHAQKEVASPNKWSVMTDLASPLRGNSAISLIANYQSNEKYFHTFGVDWVYDNQLLNYGSFPSIPKITVAQPSFALTYSFNKKFGRRFFIGIQPSMGNYRFHYSRTVCLQTTELPEVCRCDEWTQNEFTYNNLKLMLQATSGFDFNFKHFHVRMEVRLGGYTTVPLDDRPFMRDNVDCSDITIFIERDLEEEFYDRNDEQAFMLNHNTVAPISNFSQYSIQAAILVGYKF